jgi:peptidyl-prolyl cis-trans isomerase D
MLQAINDRIKGWLGIVVVILIGLPFALWGIQSYLDDSGPRYAAKVNKSEISANELERMVSLQRQSLLRQNNGKLPIEEKLLRERTLTQLINQRLLEGFTYNNGYRISDTVLSERIKQLFSVDGVFDRASFEASIASYGMNIPMYEQTLRNELRLQQMQSAIVNSAFVTRDEVNKLAALNEQTRDISVLTFNVEHFSTASNPTEEEIKQYYEANLQQFMMPEKIKVDYVEITSDSLAETATVDEAQVKKMYDDYVASASGREERKARHILIQTGDNKAAAKAKIESIKQELEHGANFADLANKYSQDAGSASQGGDLGWVASGEMVKPFEQALFTMAKGSVSDIVETQFGYHLIELDDIRSEPIASLDVKRYEFEDELKAEAAASMFYDLTERLASTAYENPSSLDAVVGALDLKVKTSDYFTRSSGEGVAADEKLRNVAFSPAVLEQGSNSDIIEINPKHVIVLRLNDHVPATEIPLETVSSKIENILKIKNGHEQTRMAALDIKSKIEAGTPVKDLIVEGFTVEDIASLGRNDKAKVSDPSILYNAFDLPPNQNNKPSVRAVDLISGDVALVVLSKVNLADNIPQDKLDLIRSEALSEEAVRDFSNALLAIIEKADIDKNMSVVDR